MISNSHFINTVLVRVGSWSSFVTNKFMGDDKLIAFFASWWPRVLLWLLIVVFPAFPITLSVLHKSQQKYPSPLVWCLKQTFKFLISFKIYFNHISCKFSHIFAFEWFRRKQFTRTRLFWKRSHSKTKNIRRSKKKKQLVDEFETSLQDKKFFM